MPSGCRGKPIVGETKGVLPLGRRALVHAPIEEGRQEAQPQIRATVGSGNAEQFPIQVDLSFPKIFTILTVQCLLRIHLSILFLIIESLF